MIEFVLTLPFPPSVNNLFSQGVVKGKVRRFPTPRYKKWRREAVTRIRFSRPPRFEDPVVVKLELTPRDSRPRDADNYVKPVLDALVEAGALPDDSNRYVKAVIPYWQPASRESGVQVMVRPATQSERPELTDAERAALARIKDAGGYRVCGPNFKPSVTIKSLVEKGYVRVLPGLFPGACQGLAIV